MEAIVLELLFYFLKAMHLENANLLIHLDGQGAVGAFKKGHCPNWHINLVLHHSFLVLACMFIHPTYAYIESSLNPADPISHGILPPCSSIILPPILLPKELHLVLQYV